MAWFAKDSQMMPEPEEALAQLPDDLVAKLIGVANQLPVHQPLAINPLNWVERPCEVATIKQRVEKQLGFAIKQFDIGFPDAALHKRLQNLQ